METIPESEKLPETEVQHKVEQKMNYNKTIIFLFMGDEFNHKFLQCWMELFNFCMDNGIKPLMSMTGEQDTFAMKNMLLGGSMNGGSQQKPFQGKIDYDYMLWIDSKVLFTIENFKKLLDGIENYDIVSGIHPTSNMKAFNAIENTELSTLRDTGSFTNIPREKVEEAQKSDNTMLKVDYVDFHFTMMKKGVFECIEYPWFKGTLCNLNKNDMNYVENYSPFHGACNTFKQKGFKIMIDTSVIVPREMTIII